MGCALTTSAPSGCWSMEVIFVVQEKSFFFFFLAQSTGNNYDNMIRNYDNMNQSEFMEQTKKKKFQDKTYNNIYSISTSNFREKLILGFEKKINCI